MFTQPPGLTIVVVPTDNGNPPGKLADVELHFTDGPLVGLKLAGFCVWERRGGGARNVTFPARSYNVNDERRSFALLRPTDTIRAPMATEGIRDAILAAYADFVEAAHVEQAERAAGVQ